MKNSVMQDVAEELELITQIERGGCSMKYRAWIGPFALILGTGFLASCGKKNSSSEFQSDNPEYKRTRLGWIEFAGESDYVHVGAMLEKVKDKCRFKKPTKPDASTPWAPIQTVWASGGGVATIDGVYHKEDTFAAASLNRRGFKYLTNDQMQKVGVTDLKLNEERDVLTGRISIQTGRRSYKSIWLNANAVMNAGQCSAKVTYRDDTGSSGDFKYIHIRKKTFLGVTTGANVTINGR